MSSPPSQPQQTYERPYYGPGAPPIPVPTGELVVFALVWLVIGIITLAADNVSAPQFVTASVALAVGYMLSRGLAKLGKVLENR